MLLLSIFSAVALLLSSTGLYGVISYSVSQRTQEIGIRMALGAKPSQLLAMVLTQGLRLSGAGLVAGILGALALNHILKGMLVGVSTTDALVFACGAATAAAVALLACLVPARRAMRLDPVAALRQE